MQANESQRKPTQARDSQRRPTQGQSRPTTARRPTMPDKLGLETRVSSPGTFFFLSSRVLGGSRRVVSRAPGMFSFFIYFIINTNNILQTLSTTIKPDPEGPRKPTQAHDRH